MTEDWKEDDKIRKSEYTERQGKLRFWETSVLAMGKGVTKGHFVLRYWGES